MRCANWTILLIIPIALHSARNPFPKIADIDLNARLAAVGQSSIDHPVAFAASFSPNGARLAFVFGSGPESAHPSPNQFLMVVDTLHVSDTVYWTDLSSLQSPLPPRFRMLAFLGAIVWAPDSKSLLIADQWIQIPSGSHCSLEGEYKVFVAPDLLIVQEPEMTPYGPMPGSSSHYLTMVATGCKSGTTWPGNALILAASPELGLLAVAQSAAGSGNRSRTPFDLTILSTQTAATPAGHADTHWLPPSSTGSQPFNFRDVQTWPTETSVIGSAIFVNGLLCNFRNEYAPALINVQIDCHSPQTGQIIRRSHTEWNVFNLFSSSGGGRIAITDYALPSGTPPGLAIGFGIRTRGIWDSQTGKTIAKWSIRTQSLKTTRQSASIARAFAISPDGHILADAGDGPFAIYRIP